MHETTKENILRILDEIGQDIRDAVPDKDQQQKIWGKIHRLRKIIEDENATPRSTTVHGPK